MDHGDRDIKSRVDVRGIWEKEQVMMMMMGQIMMMGQ